MDYEWIVTSMTSASIGSETNVIINVKWTCTGTNIDGYKGTFNGATPLTVNNIDLDFFVPYEQLTQELVLSWVRPIVENNAAYWQHINEQINKQILINKGQVTPDVPLPWVHVPTPPTPPAP